MRSIKFFVVSLLMLALLPICFGDEVATGQFVIGNATPDVTGDDISVKTNETGLPSNETFPTDVGETIDVEINWTDLNGDPVTAYVCQDPGINGSGCTNGTWGSFGPTSDSPIDVYFPITENETQENYTIYVYVCDYTGCTGPIPKTFWVNHRPYASNVSVIPATAYTSSTLTCNYTFNDPDTGDTENVSGTEFQWSVQNESAGAFTIVPGQTSSTLGSSYFDETDTVRCAVKAHDNHNLADDVYIASANNVTILNTAPTGASAVSNAATSCAKDVGDSITFSLDYTDADQADPENEPVRSYVCRTSPCNTTSVDTLGTCNGAESSNDGSTINCSYTAQQSDGDSFTAYVAACDDNNECDETSVTVYVNHAPSISGTPDILPDDPKSNQNLTCTYTFSDSDSGSSEGSSTFEWYRDQGSGYVLQGSYTSQVLPYTATTDGDTWICSVTPVDQCSLAGDAVNSTNESVSNTPPDQITGFAIQDGASSWDFDPNIDTHDKAPNLNWTTNDIDGDPVTTYICVATNQTNLDTWNCVYSSAISGHSVNDIGGITYSGTSVTYYIKLIPNDGLENGTAYNTTFDLLNSLPNTPNLLSPLNYHTQTPTFTWNVTDPDDGTVDRWPADTLTHRIRVGSSCGVGDYHLNDSADNNGEVSSPIPWGIPGAVWANRTACVRVWANDGAINGPSFELNTTLYDYLPDITSVEMANDGSIYNNCNTGTCILTPVIHSNTTVAVRIIATDIDDDCDTVGAGSAFIHLCLVNGSTACDESNNAQYYWNVDDVERSGSTCTYTFTANKTASEGTPEFFRDPANDYKLHLNVTSQAGERTSDAQRDAQWEYAELIAVDYPDLVLLGDGNIDLGEWNNGTSLAVLKNWGNVVLDSDWNTTDPDSGTDQWNLTGTDMQLDDDSIYNGGEGVGVISPVFMDGTLRTFQAATGLQRCVDAACNSGAVNETLDTYYHIQPPIGLTAGTYNSTITIVLTKH